ncbi:MAG: hypothetical protein ABS86_06245 [Sphingobium sp. SCN 64-10]|nr:MAG: hypothetical protein ABS86_06245 [Sphingobium sp. SCN 64-10]
MGRIAGKGAEGGMPPGAPVAAGETGVAIGGTFAALVAFAAQGGPRPAQGELRLIVDNGATLPDGAAALIGEGAVTVPGSDASATTPLQEALRAQFVRPHATSGEPVAAGQGNPLQAPADGMPGSEPVVIAASGEQAGDVVPAAESPKVDENVPAPAAAQVFTVPSGAAATAVLAPWTAQQTADPVPSTAAPTVTAETSVATVAQIMPAGEARPKAGVKAAAQPTVPAPILADMAGTDGDGSTGVSTTASGRTSESAQGASIGTSAPAPGGAMPLRMIVESLPPVVQSTLAAGGVATVSGPSAGAQLGEQVIDMGVSGQWIDRMAREITALAEGNGHSRFTLNPPHLGRLQVDLWQGPDMTGVRLVAETDEAARRLNEGRSALQADARMAAINLGSITVEKAAAPQESGHRAGGQPSGQMQQQMAGQGQGQGQSQDHARAGTGQPQGDWAGRSFRDQQNQQGEPSPGAAGRQTAGDHVRFA